MTDAEEVARLREVLAGVRSLLHLLPGGSDPTGIIDYIDKATS